MDISTSGISVVNKQSPIEALLFDDPICPKCGHSMMLYKDRMGGKEIPIRYVCCKCNFLCPIEHTDTNKCKPSYGQDVYNFLHSFGEDINDRIRKGK